MDPNTLLPGLMVEVQGKGDDKGDLIADRVTFDPSSMRASRQIDTRVSPLEARAGSLENREGQLEGRAGQLEGRAGQMETRTGQLEDSEKQTQQQVGQVKTEADAANQGVGDVNRRVTDLDNYQSKYSTTVYFKVSSVSLTPQSKQDLDQLAKQAQAEKGYVIEVAGFADKTGGPNLNQRLSQERANAVIAYLEQKGDIPIHRILAPAGMGTSHEAADNTTLAGRKLNRRVEVRVLVNEGLTGSAPAEKGENGTGGTATMAAK
jgi:outer membrane protein OmpA-like peptidoglycan-associated protein